MAKKPTSRKKAATTAGNAPGKRSGGRSGGRAPSGDASAGPSAEARLTIAKTYKLFIKGGFPRSESGRSWPVARADGGGVFAHLSLASRKDLRDAVVAARAAQPGWAARAAYNRGQILYRMGEMLEGRRSEFISALVEVGGASEAQASREFSAAADRLVHYAGWADKFQQVLGTHNPVAGPFYNFTVPEATGVVAVVTPDEPSLLGLVSLMAPPLCAGCSVVALGSEREPVTASLFGEVLGTSDVPAGVVNILTGQRDELLEHVASHRDIDAVHAAGLTPEHARALRLGAADSIKRVTAHGALAASDWRDDSVTAGPWWIEPFVEMKTIWHPAGT